MLGGSWVDRCLRACPDLQLTVPAGKPTAMRDACITGQASCAIPPPAAFAVPPPSAPDGGAYKGTEFDLKPPSWLPLPAHQASLQKQTSVIGVMRDCAAHSCDGVRVPEKPLFWRCGTPWGKIIRAPFRTICRRA